MTKKTKKKATLEDLIKSLDLNSKKEKVDSHAYGKVMRVNEDGTYQVSLNGSTTTVKCARLAGAKVGDTVFVHILKNGFSVVTNTLGGDKDAADALENNELTQEQLEDLNSYFWTVDGDDPESGAHITEIPKEEFEDDPQGGNVIIKSVGVYLRKAREVVASFLNTGITIGSENGYNLFINSSGMYFRDGTVTRLSFEWNTIDNYASIHNESGSPTDSTGLRQGSLQMSPTSTSLRSNTIVDNETYNYATVKGESSTTEAESYTGSEYHDIVNNIDKYANVQTYADATGSKTTVEGDDVYLNGDITINNKALFRYITFTGSATIDGSSGSGSQGNSSIVCTGTIPTGYIPFAIRSLSTNHAVVCSITRYVVNANDVTVGIRNHGNGSQNVTVTAEVLCIQEAIT